MTCPLCGHNCSGVLRSRSTPTGVVRTRQCDRCGHRWRTVEIPQAQADQVQKARRLAAELIATIDGA